MLLEIISYVNPDHYDAICKCLLNKFGSVSSILSSDAGEIVRACPCSKPIAGFFESIHEVILYCMSERENGGEYVNGIVDVIKRMYFRISWRSVESIYAILLDKKNKLIREEFINQGTVSYVDATVREISRRALLWNASAIVLAHNHPSGDPQPSPQDMKMTKELTTVLDKLDIKLHDHLIFSKNLVYSIITDRLIDISETNL